jgi:hypothetical protein
MPHRMIGELKAPTDTIRTSKRIARALTDSPESKVLPHSQKQSRALHRLQVATCDQLSDREQIATLLEANPALAKKPESSWGQVCHRIDCVGPLID